MSTIYTKAHASEKLHNYILFSLRFYNSNNFTGCWFSLLWPSFQHDHCNKFCKISSTSTKPWTSQKGEAAVHCNIKQLNIPAPLLL